MKATEHFFFAPWVFQYFQWSSQCIWEELHLLCACSGWGIFSGFGDHGLPSTIIIHIWKHGCYRSWVISTYINILTKLTYSHILCHILCHILAYCFHMFSLTKHDEFPGTRGIRGTGWPRYRCTSPAPVAPVAAPWSDRPQRRWRAAASGRSERMCWSRRRVFRCSKF